MPLLRLGVGREASEVSPTALKVLGQKEGLRETFVCRCLSTFSLITYAPYLICIFIYICVVFADSKLPTYERWIYITLLYIRVNIDK